MRKYRLKKTPGLSPGMHSGLLFTVLLLLASCQPSPAPDKQAGGVQHLIHYVEIVTDSVQQHCTVLEQVHGISFGPEVQDLGFARVVKTADGTLIGVRAPLAEHEKPIVRVYYAVDNIAEAMKKAETAGAVTAYPPTIQGDTGTWAIYILDGIQYGLWQQ